MANRGIIVSIEIPWRICETPLTQDMQLILDSPTTYQGDWCRWWQGGCFSKEGGKIRQGLYRRIRGRDYPKGCFKYRHSTIENSANMEPDSKYGWRQLGRGGKCATIIIIKTLQMVVLWWWFFLMRHLPGNQYFLYFSVFTYDKPRCGVHQFNAWKG